MTIVFTGPFISKQINFTWWLFILLHKFLFKRVSQSCLLHHERTGINNIRKSYEFTEVWRETKIGKNDPFTILLGHMVLIDMHIEEWNWH